MAECPPHNAALLATRSFPRFRKGRWEDFQDIVTPEQAYYLAWRVDSLCSADSETMTMDAAQNGDSGRENTCAGRENTCAGRENTCAGRETASAELNFPAPKGDVSVGGETVLWAYPNDIGPLAVGHVLLDLCPSSRCLSRKVSLYVESPAGSHSGKQDTALDKELAEEQSGNEGACPVANCNEETAKVSSANLTDNRNETRPATCKGAHNGEAGGGATKPPCDGLRFFVTVGEDSERPLPSPPDFWQANDVLVAMDAFIKAEGLWDSTGCFHRAGVYDMVQGKLIKRAEDIGRHNCVDRLAGWSVLENIPLSDKVLLISARMTSSLCAKAIRAGFPVIVSRSAVTTAAIAMAKEAHVTLLGFARTQEQRFTVFNQGRCSICHEEE